MAMADNMSRTHGLLLLLTLILFMNARPASALVPRFASKPNTTDATGRSRININSGWRFRRTENNTDGIVYDIRPDHANLTDLKVLKPWILPSGNDFIKDPAKRYELPTGSPGANVSLAQSGFDDSAWESVNLPHDWAIKGPFYQGDNVPVKGGMGRLPVQGVGWYRRKLTLEPEDANRTVYLDIDGAMSYAMVWLNGHLVGGWPFGYSSFRLDLTPYLKPGDDNLLAIRVDNPTLSSRWYPGAGLYRSVWLTKVGKVHVGQWGTQVTTQDVSEQSATVNLVVEVENKGNAETKGPRRKMATFPSQSLDLSGKGKSSVSSSVTIPNPQLWGPLPSQRPNLYIAVTRLLSQNTTIDTYTTQFGIRSVEYSGDKGLIINNQRIRIQGVNQHHDLGALGTAFNLRAATRQLEYLRELGCNAVRMSHNPPATELLELTDRMGFVVVDEIFDMWERNKTTNDAHLIFPEWHEQDLRSFIRRDRNHASVAAWSVGNEVGEQYTDEEGAAIGRRLVEIAHEEDGTRPVTASMNYAKPDMPWFVSSTPILQRFANVEGSKLPTYASSLRRRLPVPLQKLPYQCFANSS
jgi:beta-galactosidase